MKNDENVPSKRSKHKNISDPDPKPDPLVEGTDPRIRIRINGGRAMFVPCAGCRLQVRKRQLRAGKNILI
jgi:hypothetical protein